MLYDRFRQFLVDERLDLAGHVLVGLSGGVDSIVLVDLVRRLGSRITCLHVNYGLRGTESDLDEAFVRDFCRREAVDLSVFDAGDEMAPAEGASIQALARKIRYREYEAAAAQAGIEAILLGHHADDQVETILLNLFRGAGLNGLAGMPVARPVGEAGLEIVRPLLFARRRDIEEYARTRGLSWRDDASNEDARYRRVALRREVIPLIEAHFGGSASLNVLRTAEIARRMLASYGAPAGAATEPGDALHLDRLEGLAPVARTQVILDALSRMLPEAPRSRAVVEQIERLTRRQTGSRVQLGGSSVIRERSALRFLAEGYAGEADGTFEERLEIGGTARVPGGVIVSLRLSEPPSSPAAGAPNVAYLDADALIPPLRITEWRAGDRLRPYGLDGTKKVSDLLTDEKIPNSARARIPVLRSGEEIAWVVGVRPSADFALTSNTSAAVAFIFLPAVEG